MIESKSLGLVEARKIVDAMVEYTKAAKPGKAMSHAVVDSAGVLICLVRMDGASIISRRMAENKAYTVIVWQNDTRDTQKLMKAGRDIAWFGEIDRQAVVPGGIPIRAKDGSIIGAVGSSGLTADEDEEVALIGVNALTGL